MPYNIYVVPSIGDGLGPWTAYRVNYADTVEINFTTTHSNAIFFYGKKCWLCFVNAPDSVHTHIQGLTGTVRLIPMTSVTLAQLRANYDTPLASIFPAQDLVALKNNLEQKGFPMDWADASTTLKDTVKHLRQICMASDIMLGENNTNAANFLTSNLDATVGSLTAAVRNAARTWMQSKGLDTSWITNSNTVRQVMRYIARYLNVGDMITSDGRI